MTAESFRLDTATAPIAVRVWGDGPAIVLVPGGLQTAADFDRLASHLAGDFTAIAVDRRGRGDSRDLPPLGGLDAEAHDILAVTRAFDAQLLFGLSSGALIALRAAELASEDLDAVVLYEPPLATPEYANDFDWIDDVGELLNAGRCVDALTLMIEVIADHPIVRLLPRSVLRFASKVAIRFGRSANGDPLSVIVPTFAQDARVVQEARETARQLPAGKTRFLLVNGDRAAEPLVGALDALDRSLPSTERRTLSRVGHLGAVNGGKPARVAVLLREFFARSVQ
ncbi:alpha/beta hydrolase [Leucobacter sp. CSA2]|uniref:Alpha/beta hydrolase n=1 Tax=Leucobacter edaphi TaxID=2796472 RepID=A0A934UVY1_9MICO|nr:alpha/beta hydrolase [Leucobacter edaphi]MBK0421069.1 alpha/beta hydrolase [Leucobacter edaphi]